MDALTSRRSVAILSIAAIAALASGEEARAGFIASDLGPNNAFDVTSAYTLSGPGVATRLGYGLAVEFAVGGPAPVAFGSAILALEYHGGAAGLDVLLLSDDGGLPGATLESIHLASVAAGPSLVVATSTAQPMLAAGSDYWLAAVASNDSSLSWMANSMGAAGHLAYRTDHGFGPGPWGTAGAPDPAFAIAAVTAIPAPPSAILTGVGLLGLACHGARRRRRGA